MDPNPTITTATPRRPAKRTIAIAALLGATLVSFAAGRASGIAAVTLHPQTAKNIDAAMHGEAFAFAKYSLFAQHARSSGHPEIAALFEDAARTERLEHFAEEAEIAGLVGSDADNLRDAIRGENYETTTMYPQFAEEAKAAGDAQAATRFGEVKLDEAKHRDAFQAALNRLNGPAVPR